jgi:hypothetical protein
MKRLIALASCCAIAAAAGWSCDDEGENGGDATATAPPATATAGPQPSPTPLASGIVIEQPAEDATVTVPVTMSGAANVFEAALTIDALGNAAGLTLCTRHVQATSGTGTPGTWEGVLAFQPPPSAGPITLRAYTFSPMDGSMQDLVERAVTVSAELPAIVIETPVCAQQVSGTTLTVSGTAEVFEAALSVDIRNPTGHAVLSQNVMAASGVERSPWTVTFDLSTLPGGGFYDVVAYTHSAEDGSVIDEFPVQISYAP